MKPDRPLECGDSSPLSAGDLSPSNGGTRPAADESPHSTFRSCLYDCSVMHHRLAPKEHHFRYGIFQFCLDLDELDTLSERLGFFSRNRRNLYRFNDSDHLPPQTPDAISHPLSTKSSLLAWITSQGLPLPADTRVLLLTHCRVFGYIFNPVSFYFCLDAQDRPLCAVAEVGNTFGELKPFLVPCDPSGPGFHVRVPKNYYVSPFSPLDLEFDFCFDLPSRRLRLAIDDYSGGERVLLSTVTGAREELTAGNLARFTLRYPLVTLKVIFLIHWEALRLWLKKIPFRMKEADPELQQGAHRIH